MSGVYRRCGCRDEHGKNYGTLAAKQRGREHSPEQIARACPRMVADPKHGRWTYRLSAGRDPQTGKRQIIKGGTFGTQRDAEQARNADAAKADAGQYVRPSGKVLALWLDEWIERRQRTDKALRPTSLENYRRYIAQDIAPSRLGSMKLEDVRRHHVVAFVDELTASGRGAVTVRRIVAVLQGALSAAVSLEVIPGPSPASRLGDVLPRVAQEPFRPWSLEQVGTFLDVAVMHRLGVLYEVAVFTGLRRSELVGLAWADVDLVRGTLTVRESKTHTGRRVVDLDDRSVGALLAWQIAQAGEAQAWGGAYSPSGRVFTYEDGTALKLQYVTRLFDRLRVQADLPPMTMHGLRHMHASLMIAAGVNLAVVSKRLGHSSVAITSDVYSHLIGSASRDAANSAASLVPSRAAVHTSCTQVPQAAGEAVPVST